MKNSKFKIKNVKLAFVLLIVIAVVLSILYYIFVFSSLNAKHNFTNQMVEIADENEKSVFGIQKVLLYSSANAVDNSENQSLSNMSISQYSDISIFIDNSPTSSDLTDENTVKELYIDNISIISKNDVGTQALNYKSPASFGKYAEINNTDNKKIDFNIITLNANNHTSNYNTPSFYTDCSNPITLGYLNTNIIQNYSVLNSSNKVSYNAKILKEANINLEDINNTISFTIHIVTNSNEKFYCNVYINLSLDEDFLNNGYSFMSIPIENGQYKFYRE